MIFFLVIASYVLCVIYVKAKMKASSSEILEEIRKDVDKKNLDNLMKFSEKKLTPEGYNENIIAYKEAAAIYAGTRALRSPIETFSDFFETLRSY